MTSHQTVIIGNDSLTARIGLQGAELQSLIPVWGEEMIWQADPAQWGWHAPNLFPIVGALVDDTLVHQGIRYPMQSHGFLRHSLTTLAARTDESATFRLTDSPETRQCYPFAFELAVFFRIEADHLIQIFTVTNPDSRHALLVSLGGHPAFRWPLSEGSDRAAHRLVFARDEPQGIRRVAIGGLGLEDWPTPVAGRVLALDDSLFEPGAIVWDQVNSRMLSFGVPGQEGVEVYLGNFPHLGVWSKPGARFLCIEPWQGHMSPVGFRGELADKPGIASIPPGASRRWTLSIRPVERLPVEP